MTNEYSFILKPSSIQGVGVYATHFISKNSFLDLFDDCEGLRFMNEGDLDDKQFIKFGVKQDNESYCLPIDFRRMSIGWYLNHSNQPNVYTNDDNEFYSLEEISPGDELTIDYKSLEPDFTEKDLI